MDGDRLWTRQEARADLAEAYWRLLGARPGWRLADVGCGPGAFALRYASMTGPTGHVHAVDADPEALAYLAQKMDPIHHAHVSTELLDIEERPLPDLPFDAILCTATLHHVDDIGAALANLRETKAPLLVGEFDPNGPGEVGPPLEMRLGAKRLIDELARAGWRTREVHALRHESYAVVAR